MTIRLGTGCLLLLLAAAVPAEEQPWSERFPAIAQRIAGVATDLRPMPGGGAGSSTLLTGITVSGV